MKLPKAPRHQLIGFWVSMPFITLALCYILYKQRLFEEYRIALIAYPIIYAIGYVSWRLHALFDYHLRKKYPSLEDTRRRAFTKLSANVFIMTPSVLLIFYVFHLFRVFGYHLQLQDLKYGYLVGLAVNIVFETLWEVIYIIDKYKEAAAEKVSLEQMQLTDEFNRLKQKVNPHFLFNSFNTLSSLITEDKDTAEKFLDELSKVYRYLLRTNENTVTSVRDEIKFIESYGSLLKTRYGNAFRLDIDITHPDNEKEIPTLCLQLLVENVVKHNVISKNNPVTVRIHSTNKDSLMIQNNLMKKAVRQIDSTGVGLANIRDKYRLLSNKDISVTESAAVFTVEIPLLSPTKIPQLSIH
jgi:two-component system LytT family sensor kinase